MFFKLVIAWDGQDHSVLTKRAGFIRKEKVSGTVFLISSSQFARLSLFSVSESDFYGQAETGR